MKNAIKYILIGVLFGIILTKAQVTSWYKIYEMFRFESIHLFGVIGSAVLIGAPGLFILEKMKIKSLDGKLIKVEKRPMGKNYLIGGIIFGLGWALSGTCPGPMYANIGNGYPVFIVMIASALLGTFVYGLLKDKLPH